MEEVVKCLKEINETLKLILTNTIENGSGRAQNFETLDKNLKTKLDEVIKAIHN